MSLPVKLNFQSPDVISGLNILIYFDKIEKLLLDIKTRIVIFLRIKSGWTFRAKKLFSSQRETLK